MANIISFQDFQRKSRPVSEDTVLPTGNSTVFIDTEESPEGHNHDDHHGHEKNYMFFKNLYAMKKCIEEIMSMNKEQVDELLENGHDWASDHITSAKDDVQEVFDWLRYEVENYNPDDDDDDEDDDDDDEEDDDEEDQDDVEVDSVEIEPEEEDDDAEDGEEEEETLESKDFNYSYTEEKK